MGADFTSAEFFASPLLLRAFPYEVNVEFSHCGHRESTAMRFPAALTFEYCQPWSKTAPTDTKMAIPDLDHDGFLPAGVHECTLDELEQRFGGFELSTCRMKLMAKLAEYVMELRGTGMVHFVLVDGSFVSAKAEPNDIDLVLVLPNSHDFTRVVRPFEYNVLSRRMVRKRFAFDVLVAREDSAEFDEYVQFFQQVRGEPYRQKGILKVMP